MVNKKWHISFRHPFLAIKITTSQLVWSNPFDLRHPVFTKDMRSGWLGKLTVAFFVPWVKDLPKTLGVSFQMGKKEGVAIWTGGCWGGCFLRTQGDEMSSCFEEICDFLVFKRHESWKGFGTVNDWLKLLQKAMNKWHGPCKKFAHWLLNCWPPMRIDAWEFWFVSVEVLRRIQSVSECNYTGRTSRSVLFSSNQLLY